MKMQFVVQKKAFHPSDGMPCGDLQYWLSQPIRARLAAATCWLRC